jgi:hypothetical protein
MNFHFSRLAPARGETVELMPDWTLIAKASAKVRWGLSPAGSRTRSY